MSKIAISPDDPRANGKALEASIHETHERTIARLEDALNKLLVGSKQWVDVTRERAAEDRRYRAELQQFRDQINIATTPKYEFRATIQAGSVVWSSPEEEAARRAYDEEFGTDTWSTDPEEEPPTSTPANAVATPAAQPSGNEELPPSPYNDDDETYQYFKSLPRSGTQRPLRPRSGAARALRND